MIIDEVIESGGIMTIEDLKNYKSILYLTHNSKKSIFLSKCLRLRVGLSI